MTDTTKNMKQYFVYIITNKKNGALCVGLTTDLVRRVFKHRVGYVEGFPKRYKLKLLVYCEMFSDMKDAVDREKGLKSWSREWKLGLINGSNEQWRDILDETVFGKRQIRDRKFRG